MYDAWIDSTSGIGGRDDGLAAGRFPDVSRTTVLRMEDRTVSLNRSVKVWYVVEQPEMRSKRGSMERRYFTAGPLVE